MDLSIYNQSGTQVGTMPVDEASLGGEVRPALLKQAFVMFHANTRQGSARTKSRGMVEGSTRKLYKQKGSGNARMGAARTVIRKGGGVAFAKTRESFRRKLSKKMRQLANRNALLAKMIDFEGNAIDEIKVVDSFDFAAPKTRDMAQMLGALGVNRTCLVALNPADRNTALSARNIADVDTIRIDQLNAFEMLNHRYLVIDRAGLESFLDGSCFPKVEKKTDAGKEGA